MFLAVVAGAHFRCRGGVCALFAVVARACSFLLSWRGPILVLTVVGGRGGGGGCRCFLLSLVVGGVFFSLLSWRRERGCFTFTLLLLISRNKGLSERRLRFRLVNTTCFTSFITSITNLLST